MARIEPLNLYIQGLKVFRPDKYVKITLSGITVLIGDRESGKSTVLEALKFLGRSVLKRNLDECIDELRCCLKSECYELLSSDEEVVIPELFNKINQESDSIVIALEDVYRETIWGIEIKHDRASPKECPFIIREFKQNDDYTEKILRKLNINYNANINRSAVPIIHVVSALRMSHIGREKKHVNEEGKGLSLKSIVDNGIGIHGEHLRDILKYSYHADLLPRDRYLLEIWKQYVSLAKEFILLSGSERAVTKAMPCYMDRLCVTEESTFGEETTILFDLLSIGSRNLLTMLLELAIAKYIIENGEFISRISGYISINTSKLIVCFEEPEIALHPSTLTILMEMLVKLVAECQNKLYIVITTHSPRILLPLLKQVKKGISEGMLTEGVLKVYILRREDKGTEVYSIDIEKRGIPEISTSRALLYYSLHDLKLLEGVI